MPTAGNKRQRQKTNNSNNSSWRMRMSRSCARINNSGGKRANPRMPQCWHRRMHNQTHTFGQDMNYDGAGESAASSGESRERSAAPVNISRWIRYSLMCTSDTHTLHRIRVVLYEQWTLLSQAYNGDLVLSVQSSPFN